MAFVEVSEASIEALGIKVGAINKDDITSDEAELYEGWAIAQVNQDFASSLDSDIRILVLSLLICHWAETKQRIPRSETTEEQYSRTTTGELGETPYGQNYMKKISTFGKAKLQFIETRDDYIGRG